jgi:hypothetical protein
MKTTLDVLFLPGNHYDTPIEKISLLLNQQSHQSIEFAPWKDFDYKPNVSFAISHGENALFLKFFVKEEEVRSTYLQANDPVYKDSCVEFFIGFNEEPEYYNFEFNCIGTCLLGFGRDRKRTMLPKSTIEKIKHETYIKSLDDQGLIYWELTLVIPIEAFIHHNLSGLQDIKSRANFYKCGDDLAKPHYLAWNDIKALKPDFHLSEFFAPLNFI